MDAVHLFELMIAMLFAVIALLALWGVGVFARTS